MAKLIEVSVNIFHTQQREHDAQLIARRLKNISIQSKLTRVEDDSLNNEHRGKVYYFSRENDTEKKTWEIAKLVSDLESIRPHYFDSKTEVKTLCSIWIVGSSSVLNRQNSTLPIAMDRRTVLYVRKKERVLRRREVKQSNKKTIILESKRGTRIQKNDWCSDCGCLEKVLWHYSKSNRGEVNLCGRCKAKVYSRSFDKGKIDVMDTPLVYISAFETNRKKH
ncbi:MAG: hypothetical protein JST85_06995 [Acidobacteria bacterium]|nr:hypothetical protein [Acidobacteriota bacterium]